MASNNNKKQTQKADVEFVKGLSVKHTETKFGDIIKLGVNLEQFCGNEVNDNGFINIEIKKAKSGNYYAVIAPQFDK